MKLAIPNREDLPEWARTAFDVLTARLNTVWNVQHASDGSHGRITERGRTTPMGEWVTVPFNPTDYAGNGSMTWTVALANVVTFKYMLVGKTMFVMGLWTATSVGGTPNIVLTVKIPGGFLSADTTRWASQGLDNGVVTSTQNRTNAAGRTLNITRQNLANWTASAANTEVAFHGFFEVQ